MNFPHQLITALSVASLESAQIVRATDSQILVIILFLLLLLFVGGFTAAIYCFMRKPPLRLKSPYSHAAPKQRGPL